MTRRNASNGFVLSPNYRSFWSTEFTRYSRKTGFWDEDSLSETVSRFCKCTYDITDGYLIVTDLQGIKRDNGDFF